MKLNVNDRVRVKMLPLGEEMMAAFRADPKRGEYFRVCFPEVEPGVYEAQLHMFLAEFGNALWVGVRPPFTEIEVMPDHFEAVMARYSRPAP